MSEQFSPIVKGGTPYRRRPFVAAVPSAANVIPPPARCGKTIREQKQRKTNETSIPTYCRLAANPAGRVARRGTHRHRRLRGRYLWQLETTGEAFGQGPAHGTASPPNAESYRASRARAWSNCILGGDKSPGTLTSPAAENPAAVHQFPDRRRQHARQGLHEPAGDGKVARHRHRYERRNGGSDISIGVPGT